MPTIKDNAVCLRLMDWSETSQIAVFLTERHGKVSAVAKGAKRHTPSTLAKFSGGIELLTAGEAVLLIKPTSGLAQITEWDLTESFWHLRHNFDAYRLAMYAADLVHHIVQDHDPHPNTFAALLDFVRGTAEPQRQPAALLRFQWSVVEDMGLRPVLDRDAETGRPLDESAPTLAFSATAGGVVADTGRGDRWRVRAETVRLLRVAGDHGNPDADDEAIGRANRLLCTYFRAILDKHLPTMDAVL